MAFQLIHVVCIAASLSYSGMTLQTAEAQHKYYKIWLTEYDL